MSPGDVAKPATRSALEDVIARFPRSSYADYARFALARSHLRGLRPTAEVSEGERAAAIALLERIALHPFAYSPNALVLLSRAQAPDVGKAEKIRTTLGLDFSDALETLEVQSAPVPGR